MYKQKQKKSNQKGVTLIALVVTVIILIILAGVSITMVVGENGILTRASDAKIETAVAAVKENLHLDQIEKTMNEEELTAETLLAEGKVKRTVQKAEDENYYMYYTLQEDAVGGMQGLGKGNVASLRDVFLIDDDLNVKYIASNGKEYGDNIEEKILEDETDIRFSSEAFSEFVSNIAGTEEDEMKFKWMKNLKELTIDDPAIDSLQDLVFFPNLEKLILGNAGNASKAPEITTMDGIENCTKLTVLCIYYGPDKDYKALGRMENLTDFRRYTGNDFNQIIDGLKLCENLEQVWLSAVNIDNMKRIGELNNDIEVLNLSSNNITKIEGIEDFTNLKTLYLNNNNITDITPLSLNTSLMLLTLMKNSGIDGDRLNYTGERLEALNKIGEILDRGGRIYLDADKIGLFNNYNSLQLTGQNLTTLDILDGMTNLKTLMLDSNKITLDDEKSQEILKSMVNLTYLIFPTTN